MKIKQFQVEGLEQLQQKVNQLTSAPSFFTVGEANTLTTTYNLHAENITAPSFSDEPGNVRLYDNGDGHTLRLDSVDILTSLSEGDFGETEVKFSKETDGSPRDKGGAVLSLKTTATNGSEVPVRISGVADPVDLSDAANKRYVDNYGAVRGNATTNPESGFNITDLEPGTHFFHCNVGGIQDGPDVTGILDNNALYDVEIDVKPITKDYSDDAGYKEHIQGLRYYKLDVLGGPTWRAVEEIGTTNLKWQIDMPAIPKQYYSLQEVDTGKKWIDGKTIYGKVVDFGAMPNSTQKQIPHNIQNLEMVCRYEGVAKYQGGGGINSFFLLPYVNKDNQYSIKISIDTVNIFIETAVNRGPGVAFVWIEYTKTSPH